MGKRPILFVDRDGTLIKEPADEQVDRIDKIRLVPGVINALQRLTGAGWELVMVTNQDGLGTESFPEAEFTEPHEFMVQLFESQGITFAETFVCPHRPEDGCQCRKPATGLLTRFLAANQIDMDRSAVVGDRATDVQLADAIGIKGFLLDDGLDWNGIAHQLLDLPRTATLSRNTNETRIDCEVDLDAPGPQRISTGIGFLDHMLEQLSKHGGFALTLTCTGDLHIDDHHTIEDIALTLGAAVKAALGDKRGIGRYGFVLPMDEAQTTVAVDLSGRPATRYEVELRRERIGELASEMLPHFFQSFAQALGAAIHIRADGDNDHHIVEGCFKGLGRALRPALERTGEELPSTKGML
ncbi:MAG: bifunctional histidinol-phosphatase/imidazoleglycerol-phosphate dehydratase HisB [Pseudomonadota bacterium]